MGTAKKVFNNTFYLTIARICNLIMGMIWIAFLSRYIGPDGIGKFSYAQSILAILLLFVEFGFQNFVVRKVSIDKSSAIKYFVATLSTKLILSLIFYGAFITFVWITNYWDSELKKIMFVVSATTFLQALISSSTAIFFAYERMKYEALGIILRSILALSAGILAINLEYDFIHILIILFLISWIRFFFNYYYLFKIIDFKSIINEKWFDWRFNLNVLKKSIPFAILTFIGVIYSNIVIIILRIFVNDINVGYFSAAQKIYGIVFIIPSMFLSAIFPSLTSSFNSSVNKMKIIYLTAYRYLWVISLPMAVGIILTAKYFILIIFGQKFTSAVQPLQILAVSILNSVGYLNSPALLAMGKEKFLTFSFGFILMCVSIASYLLIANKGVVGACWALTIGNGIGFFLYSISIFRWLNLRYPIIFIIKTIFAALIMGIVINYLLLYINFLIVSFVIAPFIYIILILSFNIFNKDDFSILKSLIPNYSKC